MSENIQATISNPLLQTYEGARNVLLENTAKYLSNELVKLQQKESDIATSINENPNYEDRLADKQELDLVKSKIETIQKQLRGHIVHPNGCCNCVGVGSLVTLMFGNQRQPAVYFLETVANGPKSLGIDSPVGKAILGKRVGETVSYSTKDGVKREVTINKIGNYDEAKKFLKNK